MVSEGVGRCSSLDNTVSSFFSPPSFSLLVPFPFSSFAPFRENYCQGEERRGDNSLLVLRETG